MILSVFALTVLFWWKLLVIKYIIYNFRSDAAESMKALFEITGLERQTTAYKALSFAANMFHAMLQRNNFMSFSKISAKCTIKSKNKKDGKTKTAEINRSILNALNSHGIKFAVALDFWQILQYSVCPVPSSICNGDGMRHRTNQSKLKEVLLIGVGSLDKSVLASSPKDVLLVDLIALINTMVFEWQSTYEEFAQKLMQHIPTN